MATQYYGRRVSSPEIDVGEVGPGGQRACVYDSLSSTLIIYQLGGWIGTDSGSPKARIGIGRVSGSTPDPGALFAYTAELNPAASYVDITGGAGYTGDVTPFVATPGRYSLVLTSRNGTVAHSMRAAAAISAANRNFYDKSGLGSTVPTNPIGGSPSYQGQMSLWAVGMVNEAPATPINRAPFGTLTDGDATPDLAADFNDANEILPNGVAWDTVNQVQIQVRPVGSGSLKWDYTYTASAAERSAARTSRVYAGSSLSFGTNYEWRIRHSDRAGAWSDWSSWLGFMLAPAGAVATPSSPSGRITTQTPAAFVAKWTSVTSASTNAVQARLRVNGTIIKTSGTITKTVANNANISISWAESGFSTLDWGTPYTVEIRGRDTNNVWSDWSAGRDFNTNAAPSVPSWRSPANATVTTSYPKLRFKATDADGDAVTGKLQIKTDAGAVLFTRTATYNSATQYFEYQTTSTDLASYGTYRWSCYCYDGSLYSGATTVEANAAKSSELTFTYALGPVVTVTAPVNGDTLTTRTVTAAWSVSGQAKRQLFLYNDGGGEIYHSNDVATTDQFVAVLNAPIYTGNTYSLVVKITDSLGLIGYSDPVTFTVAYPPAEMIAGFAAYPVTIGTDVNPTAVLMTWETTNYPAGQFEQYDLYRVALDGIGGIATGPREHLRTIRNPLQNAFLDAQPASGSAYEYQIEQTVGVGLDELTSAIAAAQAMVAFDGVILGHVYEPETYHVDLRYAVERGNEGDWEYVQDKNYVLPTGGTKSRVIRGTRSEWNPSGSYKLISDEIATAAQRRDAAVALIEHGGTICIRDGHGEVRFVDCKGAKIRNRRLHYEVTLAFQEVDFVPGEPEEITFTVAGGGA